MKKETKKSETVSKEVKQPARIAQHKVPYESQ